MDPEQGLGTTSMKLCTSSKVGKKMVTRKKRDSSSESSEAMI